MNRCRRAAEDNDKVDPRFGEEIAGVPIDKVASLEHLILDFVQ